MHRCAQSLRDCWILMFFCINCFLSPISALANSEFRHPLASTAKATSIKLQRCEKSYREFYQKDDLDFRVVFGYKDSRPARLVTDRYERQVFLQRLLEIGFKRDTLDDEVLNLEIAGPDQRSKRIHLRTIQSSVGADDESNAADPFQKWQSLHAKEVFLEGVRTANLVIYVGHSRKGGGPDFEPPRCISDGHVNYAWYEKRHEGLQELQKALKFINKERRLVGLLSCDSDKHFSESANPGNGRTGRLSNKSALYYADSLSDLLHVIKAITASKCAPELSPSGTTLTGFF